MAGPTGFEPATSRLTIWRPNQLNDGPLKTLRIAEDVGDKPISSGWSRLKCHRFRLTKCPVPREPAFSLVGGTGIEPVTSAL
jgi:hypothetical protein